MGVSFFMIFIYMRYILLLLALITLNSCGSYSIVTRQPDISHVMAITTKGDTIRVPIQEFQRRITPEYYNGWNIYWNNSWWMYNDWYWNYWYGNPRLFQQRYFIQTPRPRVSTPRYQPRVQPQRNQIRTPQVQPNRGRSNQQTRQPQYVRPSQQRSRVTTPPPTNSNRNSTVRRGTTGGRPIKQ